MAKKVVSARQVNTLGSWAFIVGFILAVLLGVGFKGQYQTPLIWMVFVLGIVVGILNVTSKETTAFLASGTVLVVVSFFGIQVGIFQDIAPLLVNILRGVLTLFVPATIIVALRSVFVLARD